MALRLLRAGGPQPTLEIATGGRELLELRRAEGDVHREEARAGCLYGRGYAFERTRRKTIPSWYRTLCYLQRGRDDHDRSEDREMQPEGTKDNPAKPPDHEHETTIIVNAQEKTVTTKAISFEQVVDLAYDGNPPQGGNWVFTVTYRRGADESPQGSLVTGASVKVKKGMVFN